MSKESYERGLGKRYDGQLTVSEQIGEGGKVFRPGKTARERLRRYGAEGAARHERASAASRPPARQGT